jgi:methylenetetrahydrofolate dehydrogenase (NAD+)
MAEIASQEVPKTCKVVMADTIAKSLLAEVKEALQKVQGNAPGQLSLVAFLANDDPAAVKYAEWSKKACEEK